MEAVKQCTKCNEFKQTSDYYKDSSKKDGLRPDCKQCNKQHYQYNKTQILNYHKQYYQNHKTEKAEYRKSRKTEAAEYRRLRKQNDAQFRLICNLRTRLSKAIKNKSQSTKTLIGIDFDIFMKWIKFQMPAGYSMEDLGAKIHIDHVIPLSSFNLTDENQLKKAMSWVNLQPLEAVKNISKSNSINPWLTVLQEVKAKYFIKQLNKYNNNY